MQPISAIDCSQRLRRGRSAVIAHTEVGRRVVRRPLTAVLGARHWHVPLYVSAWADTHDVVLVQDEEPDGVTDIARRLDAPVCGDIGEALDAGPLDLAYVFGPHDRMVDTCLDLVERGIPFVVEKPG